MLEGSSAQHAHVYLRRRRIHIRDIWRDYIGYTYVVYVWSAQHANVYLRSRRIHVWDMWRTYIGYSYVV